MENTIFLSVIIPVFNNPDDLEKLCDSIYRNNTKEVEVIIVDDGSITSFRNIMDKYSIEYYKIENSGPSFARNFGAKKSKGEFLLFLDSDVLIPENMINKIIDFQKKEGKEILSVFYSEIPVVNNISQRCKAYFDYYYNCYKKKDGYINSFQGSSCVFQKKLFLELDGWSEDFKGATLENEEFAQRITHNKSKIYFNSSLYVHHNFAKLTTLIKIIFLRSFLWVQLKLSKKVEYDGLTRTNYTGIITLQSLFSLSLFVLIFWSFFFIYIFFLSFFIYLYGNFGFYKYLFKKEKFFSFLVLIVINYIFHLSVSLGAVIGVLSYKFYKIKY